MKTQQSRTPLEAAHAKATLLGRLFEQHGTKLSRAQQFEALAYVEGSANWHVLSAELKTLSSFGSLTQVTTSAGIEKWRIEIAHLDVDAGELQADDEHNAKLPAAAQAQVRESMTAIRRVFLDPEAQLLVFIDGVLGVIVEQEFNSEEADGKGYEAEKACVSRLQQHLLPRLAPVLTSVKGARAGILVDEDLVWNGRPTCWMFLPLYETTPPEVTQGIELMRAFAYPQGHIS